MRVRVFVMKVLLCKTRLTLLDACKTSRVERPRGRYQPRNSQLSVATLSSQLSVGIRNTSVD